MKTVSEFHLFISFVSISSPRKVEVLIKKKNVKNEIIISNNYIIT